jgi:hypothetical protein
LPTERERAERCTSTAEVADNPVMILIVTDVYTADSEPCPRWPVWRIYFTESQELSVKLHGTIELHHGQISNPDALPITGVLD